MSMSICMSTKRAVLNAEMRRAIKVSSDVQTRDRGIKRIKLLFQQNDYPDSWIERAIKHTHMEKNGYIF